MFKGYTDLRRVDKVRYMLLSTLTYENDYINVSAHEGFITDGASIPRILWTLVGCPLNGKYVGSAIIHDSLYASQLLSRKKADELFLEMLNENGVSMVKRNIMYYGIRLFGGSRWKEKPKDLIEKSRQVVSVYRR